MLERHILQSQPQSESLAYIKLVNPSNTLKKRYFYSIHLEMKEAGIGR